jgi:hypothetical protein
VFELFRPEIEEGDEGGRELVLQHDEMAKMAVDSTIAVIREMVVQGKLGS